MAENTKMPGVTTPGRQLYDGSTYVAVIDGAIVAAPTRLDVANEDYSPAPAGVRPKRDEDGYTVWTGGRIPVDPNSFVRVKLRGGFKLRDGTTLMASAFRFMWDHTGRDDDIVAYLPVTADF